MNIQKKIKDWIKETLKIEEDFYWNETNGIETKSDKMNEYERRMHFTESNLELKNIPELWKTRDKF